MKEKGLANMADNSRKVIEATPLEVLKFVLECGGENADIIASAPDEAIQALMDEIDVIKIIL